MAIDLGRVGVWMRSYGRSNEELATAAREVERLGYGAIWLGRADPSLRPAEAMLAATERIAVATGIVSIWDAPAAEVAANQRRVSAAHPDRFLLGLGTSHGPSVGPRYRKPLTALRTYLDELDAAGVPAQERILAALGPKALQLATERSLGAHPYLVTTAYTTGARKAIGSSFLATEQMVVLDGDPDRALAIARAGVSDPYFSFPNYLNNLRRGGFTDADFENSGSERLIRALVGMPDAQAIATRVREQFDAGSDHVCIQVLTGAEPIPLPELAALADVLL
jgi:probable F420-dependent oxidoreductase